MTTQLPGTSVTGNVEAAQDFGPAPLRVRSSDHYVDEYVSGVADRWDDLVDWQRRRDSEGDFFIDQLRARGVRRVLDVATGTGYHSVRLLEAGFEVVSVDGSAAMLTKAMANAVAHGQALRPVEADWRWLTHSVTGPFDAIVCLGNSFTHLFAEHDRRLALGQFAEVLADDGVLVLDHRNYDLLLDGGAPVDNGLYYCGTDVRIAVEHVDEGLARFSYAFDDGSRFHINMYPLRVGYVTELLRQTGFEPGALFGDFEAAYTPADTSFYVHLAQRRRS